MKQQRIPSINDKLLLDSETEAPARFNFSIVPPAHWCKNYVDYITKEVIPDGSRCCWRHWVGLPQRWGVRHPYYAFQDELIGKFYTERFFAIEKPPKIGMTEMYLNLAMHEACVNNEWKNGQVAIVVGTSGLNEAEKMIARCKDTLEIKDKHGYGTGRFLLPINQDYNTKKEFSLNSVEFRAHPADNIDSIRSQPNMRMIIIDEAAFFKQVDQQKVRDAVEHYVAGSRVIIVWISTAGDVPEGAMYDIMHEDKSLYRRIILDYTEGLKVHPDSLTSLYNAEMIEKLRDSVSFGRNYLHIWGHGSGNIFDIHDIEQCTQEYDVNIRDGTNCLNLDPAFGSSNYGIVGLTRIKGVIYVTEAYELEQPSSQYAHDHIELKRENYSQVTVDGHWSGIVRDLEERHINVTAIDYSEDLQKMVERSAQAIKLHKVRIHPKFKKLIEQLRSARRDKKGVVDKKAMNFDLGDAFMQGIHTLLDEGVGVAIQEAD